MKSFLPPLIPLLIPLLVGSCKPKDQAPTPAPPGATPPPSSPPAANPPATADPDPPADPGPAQEPNTPAKLEVGNRVTLDALQSATWIQGTPPAGFEPGHVYIFECWATWCGPCIEVIPHLNELHRKFHDKGLHVYGINVLEDGQEKVRQFVSKRGEVMSYPVAYTGRGSSFENQWLKPAGVRGIPHAFLVMDGALRLMTHPGRLTEDLIGKLLQGGQTATRTLAEMNAASDAQAGRQGLLADFRRAVAKGDLPAMESLYAKAEKDDPNRPYLGMMAIDIHLAKKDWKTLDTLLVENPQSPVERSAAGTIASRIALDSRHGAEAPEDLIQKTAKSYASQLSQRERTNPMEWLCLSSLQFKAGDKPAAQTSAAKANDLAAASPRGQGMPKELFQQFRQSIDADTLPSPEDLSQWIQDALRKKSPASIK